MPYFGERIDDNTTPRAYHMPAASSGWIVDGRPIDAGTAQLLDNNISHYTREMALRPLFSEPGPGTIKAQNLNGYSGLQDTSAPDVSGWANTQPQWIAWDRRTSLMWGPFFAIDDVELSAIAGNTIRKVTWQIDCNGGGTSTLMLYNALTMSTSPPGPTDTFVATAITSSGRQTQQIDQAPTFSFGARRTFRSRSSGAGGIVSVSGLPLYCWLGWYSTNASDAIIGVTAYEAR